MKIQIRNKQNLHKISSAEIRFIVKTLLQHLNFPDAEVSISFIDDLQICDLNKRYLNRNKPTNVLSFCQQEGEFTCLNPGILGDIVISVETAARDAAKGRLSFAQEIDFLIIHGLLHLLGYNHENAGKDETKKMEKMEKILFKTLYPDDKI